MPVHRPGSVSATPPPTELTSRRSFASGRLPPGSLGAARLSVAALACSLYFLAGCHPEGRAHGDAFGAADEMASGLDGPGPGDEGRSEDSIPVPDQGEVPADALADGATPGPDSDSLDGAMDETGDAGVADETGDAGAADEMGDTGAEDEAGDAEMVDVSAQDAEIDGSSPAEIDQVDPDVPDCDKECAGLECGTVGNCLCGDCPVDQECAIGGVCVLAEASCSSQCADAGFSCGALTAKCDCGICDDGFVCVGYECVEDPCPIVCKDFECGVVGAWYFGGLYCVCGVCNPDQVCDPDTFKCI